MGTAASPIYRYGRMLLQPFVSVGKWYGQTAKKHPFSAGVITSGVKTSAADAFAQKVIEGREEIDWGRHAVFCAFGFTYLGAFQYYLYNIKFAQWCGPIQKTFGHIGTSPIKTAIDQFVHHPFCYFPVFFGMKTAIQGKPMSVAVEKYKNEIWDSCKALWSVWIPAQLVNFAFVPRHFRIPFVAGVSFAWCIILSVMQGKFDTHQAQAAALTRANELSHAVSESMVPSTPLPSPTFAATPIVKAALQGSPRPPGNPVQDV